MSSIVNLWLIGYGRKLLKTDANSVHTADADPTQQFCRVGVGGVKWV